MADPRSTGPEVTDWTGTTGQRLAPGARFVLGGTMYRGPTPLGRITGGLGGAVCEALADVEPVRIRRHGILDVFGESGTPEGLYKHFKLDADGIATVAKDFLR